MRFVEHPQRQQVVGEMHLRRFPRLSLPSRVIQLVRMLDDGERVEERNVLEECPCRVTAASARNLEARWSNSIRMSWEGHSEASTLTLSWTDDAASLPDWDLPHDPESLAALAWAEALPGRVIRATHLIVVEDEAQAALLAECAEFSLSHLVSCMIGGGARLWSDFRINADGYGRMLIAANGLAIDDLGRAVQRLQELGNYRNMALTGLPVAQAGWAKLEGIAGRLEQTGRALHQRERRDDDLLSALSAESAALLSIASECDFRMSATSAYAQIVADRLRELAVQPIAGFQSLTDFTARRFHPAMRTCRGFSDRLELLSERAAQFTALLRARVETHIENQNGRLLASMDMSARMQLRLQHLVEGLSTVAISYYGLGLLSYLFKAAEKMIPGFSATLALGMAAPVVMLGVFAIMGRLRRRMMAEDPISEDDRPTRAGA